MSHANVKAGRQNKIQPSRCEVIVLLNCQDHNGVLAAGGEVDSEEGYSSQPAPRVCKKGTCIVWEVPLQRLAHLFDGAPSLKHVSSFPSHSFFLPERLKKYIEEWGRDATWQKVKAGVAATVCSFVLLQCWCRKRPVQIWVMALQAKRERKEKKKGKNFFVSSVII